MAKESTQMRGGMGSARNRNIGRPTTPPPTYIDENTPLNTSTPARIERVLIQVGEISEKGAPNTPSRSIAKAKAGGIQDLGNLGIVTLVAHQYIEKLEVKLLAASQEVEALNTQFVISSYKDFILSNIIYRRLVESKPTPAEKAYFQRIFIHTLDDKSIETQEVSVLFKSDARATRICTLGTYKKIGKKCKEFTEKYKISDQKLAELIENLYTKNTKCTLDLGQEDMKFLLDLSTLLYATEGSRHQSAYIINKMFIDLVKAGQYSFVKMHDILPMAIRHAVKTTIVIDKILFVKELEVALYYNSRMVVRTDQPKIEEFNHRTNKIVKDWLVANKYISLTMQEKYDAIKGHLVRWYDSSSLDVADMPLESHALPPTPPLSPIWLEENENSYLPRTRSKARAHTEEDGVPNNKKSKTYLSPPISPIQGCVDDAYSDLNSSTDSSGDFGSPPPISHMFLTGDSMDDIHPI